MKSINIISLIIILFTLSLQAQNIVPPGDGTLKRAIYDANPGDHLILQSGGIYDETTDSCITINKNIRITAETGYSTRPIIKNSTKLIVDYSYKRPRIFLLGNNAQLTLKGIELDGVNPQRGIDYNECMFALANTSNIQVKKLSLNDCYFHDFYNNGILVYSENGIKSLDTLEIDNCQFSKFYHGPSIDIHSANASSIVKIKSIKITNSTFYDRAIVSLRHIDQDIYINHCTFYLSKFENVGQQSDSKSSKCIIKNSLFAQLEDSNYGGGAISLEGDSSIISYCNVWKGYQPFAIHYYNGAKQKNLYSVDPLFSDPSNGNLILLPNSPMIGKSDDGSPLGDPRWSKKITSIKTTDKLRFQHHIMQNYPNPFNPHTKIKYSLLEDCFVTLKVFNTIGNDLKTLVNQNQESGVYEILFDGTKFPSGIYFYKIRTGKYTETKKMILLK